MFNFCFSWIIRCLFLNQIFFHENERWNKLRIYSRFSTHIQTIFILNLFFTIHFLTTWKLSMRTTIQKKNICRNESISLSKANRQKRFNRSFQTSLKSLRIQSLNIRIQNTIKLSLQFNKWHVTLRQIFSNIFRFSWSYFIVLMNSSNKWWKFDETYVWMTFRLWDRCHEVHYKYRRFKEFDK